MNVDIGRVTRDSRVIDDVGLDSVAFAVGMVAIEDRLGVALSEEDLLGCDTVGDLEAAILAKAACGAEQPVSALASALSEAMTGSDQRSRACSTRTAGRGLGTRGRRCMRAPKTSPHASSMTARPPSASSVNRPWN